MDKKYKVIRYEDFPGAFPVPIHIRGSNISVKYENGAIIITNTVPEK